MEPPDALRAFRRSLYECLHRRGDALFELADAILAADGAAPSPAHLSLQASHRRGWGSLYAALDRGQIDTRALRKLLACHMLDGAAEGETPVYAVDASVWARCDAETSPERGYYYHPSRHSAGQPIVAGWAYQFIAQLNFIRESWSAPVDVERVHPMEDANLVAAEQVKALLDRLGEEETTPLFVFDAGYDPVKVQQGLEGWPCQILLRLRAGRCFHADPRFAGPPAPTGRPRRHGPKMKCADPSTWPEPSAEYTCEDTGHGAVRVRAWAGLHPKVRAHADRGSRGPLPIVRGTLVLVDLERLPRGERRREPRVLWLWWHGPYGAAPDLELIWRAYVRRFDLEHTFRFFKQTFGWTTPRVRHPEQADRWTWAGSRRFHAAALGARLRSRPKASLGEALRSWPSDAVPGPSCSFVAFGGTRHTRQATETLRSLPRSAQRPPLGPGETLSGDQEGRLRTREDSERGSFARDIKLVAKLLVVKTQA